MRSWTSNCGLLVVLAMVGAAGCGDDEKPSVAERTCKQVCAKFEMCSDETDVSGCEQDCAAETFRSDAFFTTQADCAEQLACNKLVTSGGDNLCKGDPTCELNDCARDSLDVEPTEEQKDLCASLGNKAEDCNAALEDDVVEEQCLKAVVGLSDAYVADSGKCLEESCSGVVGCLDNVADDYDAPVRIFSGELD